MGSFREQLEKKNRSTATLDSFKTSFFEAVIKKMKEAIQPDSVPAACPTTYFVHGPALSLCKLFPPN